MKFGEVIKVLRYMRDVLAEYMATERRKQAAARHQAEAAAQRRAEEAAAREAEMRAAQERLLAREMERPAARRRSRRGDGAKASVPLRAMPLPPVTTDIFNFEAAREPSLPGLPPGLPPNLVALITQISRLDAALRDLFTVTEASRTWFENLQRHSVWGILMRSLSMGVAALSQRISSRMFHQKRLEAHQRRAAENWQRVRRMLDGDWKEKVRYILWTNGQRQERKAPPVEPEAPLSFAAESGW